jgi:hypothetical protein
MSDRTALLAAVDRLAGRLRALSQRRLQAGAAAQGLELARWLAARAESVEFPDRAPHSLPDDGVFVVGDQLAVAGHDLALALALVPPERSAAIAADALERVARTAKSVG